MMYFGYEYEVLKQFPAPTPTHPAPGLGGLVKRVNVEDLKSVFFPIYYIKT